MKLASTAGRVAVAGILLLAGCADDPGLTAEEAYQVAREAYYEAETPEEKARIAEEYLASWPDSERAPGLAEALLYYRGEELDDPEGAYRIVSEVLTHVEDPERRFAIGMALVPVAHEVGEPLDPASLAAELAAYRPLTFTEHMDVVDAAEEIDAWRTARDHASDALGLATPEAWRADYPEQEADAAEVAERARKRRAAALAHLGWAQHHLGETDEALATFASAEAVTDTNYVGIPETPLGSYWGRALVDVGRPGEALEKLAPDAVMGGDEDARAALRRAFEATRPDDDDFTEYLWSLRERFAPPVDEFTLTDYDGEQVSLSDFNGQVVMLAFWFPT